MCFNFLNNFRPETFLILRIIQRNNIINVHTGGADKSLARPTSRCVLFDGENISFYASLVLYIYIYIYIYIYTHTHIYIVLIFLQL